MHFPLVDEDGICYAHMKVRVSVQYYFLLVLKINYYAPLPTS